MKYVAKDLGDAADASAGQEDQWAEFFKLVTWSTVIMVAIYFLIVYSSEFFVSRISVEDENSWFGQTNFSDELQLEDGEASDTLIRANQLLKQLVAHPKVPALDYKLIVIDAGELNAFAFPGGTIGLTSGLIDKLEQDSALAFVLAHELGHFKHRHHLKGFSKALGLGIVFSLVLGNNSDLMVTQNLLYVLDARHSQVQETESDEFGARIVMETLHENQHIEGFFQLLNEKEVSNFSFLSSHPSSDERIEHLKSIIFHHTSKSE